MNKEKFILCPNCDKKLFKADFEGKIEIICRGCGAEVKVNRKKVFKTDIDIISYN